MKGIIKCGFSLGPNTTLYTRVFHIHASQNPHLIINP